MPKLTKYERAKLIGVRAEQLANGAKPCIDIKSTDYLYVAEQELLQKKMPIVVIRPTPNGEKEYKLSDFNNI